MRKIQLVAVGVATAVSGLLLPRATAPLLPETKQPVVEWVAYHESPTTTVQPALSVKVKPKAKIYMKSDVRLTGVTRRMVAVIQKYYPDSREIYITSAYDGAHARGSLHYYGLAIDIGSYNDRKETQAKNQGDLGRLARWLYQNFWYATKELIHCEPEWRQTTYVKNGNQVGPYAAEDHVNHIHWAVTPKGMKDIEWRAKHNTKVKHWN